MCGILVKSNHISLESFEASLRSMRHRGPDECLVTSPEEGLYLGHNRLSILDLSEDAQQPMGDGKVELVFNGEIYNFKELKEKYSIETKSTGDTEVIYKLYKKIGTKLFRELDGEFAICIYDKSKNCVYAGRDPLGVKPLYYNLNSKGFTISSEIRGITKFIGKRLNGEAFGRFLHFGFSPKYDTLIEGVHKVPPGSFMTFRIKENDLEVDRYFELSLIGDGSVKGVEDVRESIEKAVWKRMLSDVPISATLSGGVDSSIIVGLMAGRTAGKVRTYTVGFKGESNEFDSARKVSDLFKTDHTEILIDLDQIFEDLPKILEFAEEPMDKGSLIPSYYLAHLIKEKVTLIGEGADECFAGYNRYSGMFEDPLDSFGKYFGRYLQVFPDLKIEEFKDFNPNNLNSILLYDLQNEIPDYHNMRIDKMFMSKSVEARVPYLDPKVVQTALQVPYENKMNPSKKILREAFKDLLPLDILYREKQALKVPYLDWIQRDEVKQVVLDKNSQFNIHYGGSNFFETLYSFDDRVRNKGRMIWLAYLITIWFNQL